MFVAFRGLWVTLAINSHHLIACWHIFISLIIEIVVFDGILVIFAMGSEILDLHALLWWPLAIIIHLTRVSNRFSARTVVCTTQDNVLRGKGSLPCLDLRRRLSHLICEFWSIFLFKLSVFFNLINLSEYFRVFSLFAG